MADVRVERLSFFALPLRHESVLVVFLLAGLAPSARTGIVLVLVACRHHVPVLFGSWRVAFEFDTSDLRHRVSFEMR